MRFTVETELETDGRWIAEIPQVPGALAYGKTKEEATNKAYAMALRSVADDVGPLPARASELHQPGAPHRVSQWPSTKARIVYKALLNNYKALLNNGWTFVRQVGSHRKLAHPMSGTAICASNDIEKIDPARLPKPQEA